MGWRAQELLDWATSWPMYMCHHFCTFLHILHAYIYFVLQRYSKLLHVYMTASPWTRIHYHIFPYSQPVPLLSSLAGRCTFVEDAVTTSSVVVKYMCTAWRKRHGPLSLNLLHNTGAKLLKSTTSWFSLAVVMQPAIWPTWSAHGLDSTGSKTYQWCPPRGYDPVWLSMTNM